MSFSWASPWSWTVTPSGRVLPSSARVVSESRIWPPCPAAEILAARTTSEPQVALVADRRLARVEAHSHPDLRTVRPGVGAQGALGSDRSSRGVARAREREEEGVALGVDLGPAGASERLADEPPVLANDLRVAISELLQEPGRALDVREDERDRPAWKCAHGTIQA